MRFVAASIVPRIALLIGSVAFLVFLAASAGAGIVAPDFLAGAPL
jgi:hypothetical protein